MISLENQTAVKNSKISGVESKDNNSEPNESHNLWSPEATDPTTRLIRELIYSSRILRHWEVPQNKLSRTQLIILSMLKRGVNLRLSDLVDEFKVDLSVLSRQVGTLIDLGMVNRDKDPDDGRAWVISLTPDGQKILDKASHKTLKAFREILKDYDEKQLASAADILKTVNQAIGAAR